ncbi:helix-turn-helix domain-containing protein [uncultured Psychroserpens sp.]|uniref:helix-turn-helix domain-containing protein n=1 Tax=uncultured Psychroserpens sp. TaxID=255436 RepID=UPI0026165935|nr:helix-turn-helix domain-containing protein [uncultured Psychroserpens sp.]
MVDETYITIKPKLDTLRKYIAYYYFNTSEEKNYTKEYIFYPHFRNAITVYKHSKISFSDNRSTVTPNSKKALEIIYTGIHSQSRIGKIHAPFDKIGIVFQPLGINNFISESLSAIVTEDPKSDFDYFGNELNKTLEQVYALSDPKEKVYELDCFFDARIQPFKDQRLLKAIDLMFDSHLGVSEISETLNISRKTLQRLFKKHLNCAPKEFSNLIKFRKAIDIYQKQKPALTDLAYQNDYYDQSDFIKHFKKVTGFNPKQFFGNLSHLGSEDTFWTVLNSK